MAMDVVRRNPPVPKKIRRVMEMFGDVRVDDYYWLRDDSRCHPDIISYLKEENEYADHIMSDTKEFQEHLFAEIKGRIKEDDISAPVRKGSYYYYRRSMKGKEYIQHCRRCIASNESSASVHDVMPTGPDAPPEHVILDENVKAEEHKGFFKVSILEVSPDNKLVAYAEDTKGGEVYTVNVIDAETGNPVGNPLHDLTTLIGWVGNDALVYTTVNEFHRPFKAWLHKLGYDQYSDKCLYHEKDDMFVVDFVVSESKEYVFVSSQSKTTGFTLCLDTCQPEKGLSLLTPLKSGAATSVSHRGDHFFIIRRSDEMYNSELLVCNKNDINSTTVLLPHRESVKIQKIQLFKDHLVVHEREGGLPKITVYNLPPIGVAIERIQGGRVIDFIDPVYSIEVQVSDYSSSILRFSYSSLRTPPSIYDYDMKTGISVLKKIESVLGDFDSSNYTTERKWAVASNGTKVPISLLYRNNLVKHDGCNPLFLYGYGSYETCIDLSFMASRLSLVDRGFIFAIAHVRGGGEMGRKWYEDGKLLKKVTTFTDFIACAEYLIEKKYTSKEKLCINGRSAGGLLIGVVLNMRPDLFKAAVSSVSFLDVLTTMLDPTIPLTTSEWEEWGDPREEEYYFYMKSYSPIDNIKPQNYPNILLTTGIYDPRVLYSESAKFVAKLRETKTDDNLLLFKCELGAGHFSKSGRFEKLHDDALTYAFILKAMGMIPSSYS